MQGNEDIDATLDQLENIINNPNDNSVVDIKTEMPNIVQHSKSQSEITTVRPRLLKENKTNQKTDN